ncbi:MAG: glycosyltransferase [Gemmatimonadetes bacterium]|nr:MAG: glycosyltransferase [Gemmatimonadota bacterium]
MTTPTRQPLNLLFVNGIREHIFRGGEKWMLLTASGLHQRGHTVLISGRPNSEWIKRCAAAGLPVYPTPLRGDFYPPAWRFFYQLVKAHHIDGVCLSMEKAVRLCGVAAKMAGVPAIVSRKGLMLMKNELLYRLAYRYIVDRVITNSHQLKTEMCQFDFLSPEKVSVVHNGVELPPLMSQSEKQQLREKFKLPVNALIIAGAGRFSPQKGFTDLINAFFRVRQTLPHVHLVLFGDGEEKPQLVDQTKTLSLTNEVHFLGHQQPLPTLIQLADLFVLSSHYEGMPNVVLEAMSAQVPVLSTNVNGVPELIEEGVSGVTVEPQNPAQLAQHIIGLLSDESRRKSLAIAGRQRVEHHFTIRQMIDGMEALFYDILAEKGKGNSEGIHH